MPITHQPGTALEFQQQMRPIGRIRTGMQEEYEKNGRRGKRPAKLGTFRLTSADVRMLERAAQVYGGVVEEWPEAPDGDALQLITEAREIDVLVPSWDPLSQWYEMWGAGGCLRRCTGQEETLSGNGCMCPADVETRQQLASRGNACKPTTRVNLLLPDMDVGSWLLVSHSYYAAVELPPVITLLAGLAQQLGRPVPAKLWIDQRRIKRPNQPPKEFTVPAIRTPVTWNHLLPGGPLAGMPAIGAGDVVDTNPALGSGSHGAVAAVLPAGDTPLPDDPDDLSAPDSAAEPPEDPERTQTPPEPAAGQDAAASEPEDGDFTLPDDDGPVTAGPTTYDAFKAAISERHVPGVTIQAAYALLHPGLSAADIKETLSDDERGVLLAAVVRAHELNVATV